jgi:cell division protein ZapE
MVFISEVPAFTGHDTSSVILWMHLIDVLYNAQVKLVIQAEQPLQALYPEDGPMSLAFVRTLSRMQEMQSQEYWHHD